MISNEPFFPLVSTGHMKKSPSSSYFPTLSGMKRNYSEQRLDRCTPHPLQPSQDPYFLPPINQAAKAVALANVTMVQDVLRHLATSELFSHCPHAVTASDSDIQLYITLTTTLPAHNTILAMLHNSLDLSIGNVDITSITTLPPHLLTPLPCPSPSPLCLLHCLATLGLRMDSISHLHRVAHALAAADASSLRMALGPQPQYIHKRTAAPIAPPPQTLKPTALTETVAGVCLWCRFWRLAAVTATRAPVPGGRVPGCGECLAAGEAARMYRQYPLWHAALPTSLDDSTVTAALGVPQESTGHSGTGIRASLATDAEQWREVGVRAVKLGLLGVRGRHLMALVWGRRGKGQYTLCGQTEVLAKPALRPLRSAVAAQDEKTLANDSQALPGVSTELRGVRYDGGGVCAWRAPVTLAWGASRRTAMALDAMEPLPAPRRAGNDDEDIDSLYNEDEDMDEDEVDEFTSREMPYEYRVCVYSLRDPSTILDSDLIGSVRLRSEELLYAAARASDDACRHHHGWGCGQNWGGYTLHSDGGLTSGRQETLEMEGGAVGGLSASYPRNNRSNPEYPVVEENPELIPRGGACTEPSCSRRRAERRAAMRAHVLRVLGDRGGDTDTESEVEDNEDARSQVQAVGAQLLEWKGKGEKEGKKSQGKAKGKRLRWSDGGESSDEEDAWVRVDGRWVRADGMGNRAIGTGNRGERERWVVPVDDANTRVSISNSGPSDSISENHDINSKMSTPEESLLLKRRAAERVGALVSYVADATDAARSERLERKRASGAARAQYWREFDARVREAAERREGRQTVRVVVPFDVTEELFEKSDSEEKMARVEEQRLFLMRTAERLRAAAELAAADTDVLANGLVPTVDATIRTKSSPETPLVPLGDVPSVVFEWKEPLLAAVHEHGDADEQQEQEEERQWALRVAAAREAAKAERQRLRREKRAAARREREEREARERAAVLARREERRKREEEFERKRQAFLAEVKAGAGARGARGCCCGCRGAAAQGEGGA